MEFKGGTAISFYKDGKVRSGTLAARQSLVKAIETRGGAPEYATIGEGTVVSFSKDGLVLGY